MEMAGRMPHLSPPLMLAAALLAYVLACALQLYNVQRGLGLSLTPLQVLSSTLKLMANQGPWVPFLMNPPSTTS